MIKYVAMVACAALAILVASPVSAFHKGPCHGAGCGGDAGGIVELAVVVDSTGAVVGQASGDIGPVFSDVLLRLDDGRLVRLKVRADRMLFSQLLGGNIVSESFDCQEPFFVEHSSTHELLFPLADVGPDDTLYVSLDSPIQETVTTNSRWDSNSMQCFPVGETTRDLIRLEPVMQLDFVPPFHIE